MWFNFETVHSKCMCKDLYQCFSRDLGCLSAALLKWSSMHFSSVIIVRCQQLYPIVTYATGGTAARDGDIAIVKRLLTERRVDVNVADEVCVL